jgi:menaquinone-specific isochorismate synthase
LNLRSEEKTLVADAIKFFVDKRYRLIAYVIMDDHVHVLVSPTDPYSLEKIIHSWKSFSSNQIAKLSSRKSPIWQGEYYDHIVRNEEDFVEKTGYILTNPQRKWPSITEYKWVWAEFMSA